MGEEKNPDISTGTQTILITVRLNRLSSKGMPRCMFIPIPLVFMEPCCGAGELIQLKAHPGKLSYAFLWQITLRLA